VVHVGALSAFALLHASVVGWYAVRHRSRAWLPHLLVPAVGTAVIVWVLVSASHTAQVVGAVWLLAGLGVWGPERRRGRAV
jgi:hypothetical protein